MSTCLIVPGFSTKQTHCFQSASVSWHVIFMGYCRDLCLLMQRAILSSMLHVMQLFELFALPALYGSISVHDLQCICFAVLRLH